MSVWKKLDNYHKIISVTPSYLEHWMNPKDTDGLGTTVDWSAEPKENVLWSSVPDK